MSALPCVVLLITEFVNEVIDCEKIIHEVPVMKGFVYEFKYFNAMRYEKAMTVKDGSGNSRIVEIE